MAKFESLVTQTSGIALGGIGTGTVELCPDGEFHYWQIANQTRWGAVSADSKADDGERHVGCLSFYVRAEYPDGTVCFRKLGQKVDPDDFTYTMFAWNRPMEKIVFEGEFPVAKLAYVDTAFPLKVTLTATAPFVPHNANLSGTPGFYLDFKVSNPGNVPVKCSLLGCFRPSFMSDASTVNKLVQDGNTVSVFMQSEKTSQAVNCGNMCFSMTGNTEQSWITAEYNRAVQEYIIWSDGLGVSQEGILYEYREKGKLPSSDFGERPVAVPENVETLTDSELFTLVKKLDQCPGNAVFHNRILRTKPGYPNNRAEALEYLHWLQYQVPRKGDGFGACALSAESTLKPAECMSASFVLSWYFPNHYRVPIERDEKGVFAFRNEYDKCFGHYYENLFEDALAVNRKMVKEYGKIAVPAQKFAGLLYSDGISSLWSDAWSVQLSTLIKDSWWLKNGKFALWEGLGYCGFHTTDITYHASFGLTVLFPELQKRQMRMGAAFQREDGRVHHFFTPDLESVDDGFERVDMNPQFVLMVCRDWLFTGDKKYVEELWPNVVRAMNATQKLDADKDGLPDTDTKRNTYDAWNFAGISGYISFLWLASLRAAVVLANVMGDEAQAKKWERLRVKGLRSLEKKLWNGNYYNLWVDGDRTDGCLMTDQLDGEWFLRAAGLTPNLTDKRVKNVLSYIFDHNFDPQNGLINATCPTDMPTDVHTYKNCQAEAVWTGIGYAFAALCLRVKLPQLAEQEIAAIDDAQSKMGRFWNHWECGFRYTRPLSSWTTLMSLSGQKMNASEKQLWLSPVRTKLTVPVITISGCALARFEKNQCVLSVVEGSFDGWEIHLPDGMSLILQKEGEMN